MHYPNSDALVTATVVAAPSDRKVQVSLLGTEKTHSTEREDTFYRARTHSVERGHIICRTYSRTYCIERTHSIERTYSIVQVSLYSDFI